MEINVGKGITVDVDIDKLTPQYDDTSHLVAAQPVFEHVIRIGLRNILMDSHAGIPTDEPDYQAKARAVVEKKLAAMYNGEVRVAGTREGDPVRAEAMRLATEQVKAALRKAGRKVSSVDTAKLREAAGKLITAELLAKAAERVAEAKALDAAVDVSGL